MHVNNIHQEVDKYGHMLWVRLWTQICVWLEADNDVDPWLVSTVCIYIFIALKKKNSYSPPQKTKTNKQKNSRGNYFQDLQWSVMPQVRFQESVSLGFMAEAQL